MSDEILRETTPLTSKPKTAKNVQLVIQEDENDRHNRTSKRYDHSKPAAERGYGNGQLTAYFQNKLSKNQRHHSTNKFANMTQTLKDLKSMIYEGNSTINEKTDAQVGIIQNAVRHSGIMKSVNALKSSFLDNAAVAKKAQDLTRMSTRGRAWNDT